MMPDNVLSVQSFNDFSRLVCTREDLIDYLSDESEIMQMDDTADIDILNGASDDNGNERVERLQVDDIDAVTMMEGFIVDYHSMYGME